VQILIPILLLQIMLAHKAIAACGTSPENVAKLLIIKAGKSHICQTKYLLNLHRHHHMLGPVVLILIQGISQTIKWPNRFNYYPPKKTFGHNFFPFSSKMYSTV
jgi:hypothetical protein